MVRQISLVTRLSMKGDGRQWTDVVRDGWALPNSMGGSGQKERYLQASSVDHACVQDEVAHTAQRVQIPLASPTAV